MASKGSNKEPTHFLGGRGSYFETDPKQRSLEVVSDVRTMSAGDEFSHGEPRRMLLGAFCFVICVVRGSGRGGGGRGFQFLPCVADKYVYIYNIHISYCWF